jgi:hypothetical protein
LTLKNLFPNGVRPSWRGSGRRAKRKPELEALHLQLAKKSAHVPLFILLASAFWGVSRQGEFENTRQKNVYAPRNFIGEVFSVFVFCFLGWIVFLFFSFDVFNALGKGKTQKRD